MRWKPVDWIVLTLAVSIILGVIGLGWITPYVGIAITDDRSKTAAATVDAIVAVIAVYVGIRLRHRGDDE